tara:strand:- start:1633 stop:1788 length:156 start_codon:yes stop_codon:yes gene_type:complete
VSSWDAPVVDLVARDGYVWGVEEGGVKRLMKDTGIVLSFEVFHTYGISEEV